MRRITIVQGEHAVAADAGTTIVTVLGSCIAVCLFDPRSRRGGMNHFLLGAPAGGEVRLGDEGRFGVHAMEVLINAVLLHGSRRSDLRAHVYGGATMVAALGDIGERNIAFARAFLTTEGIPITHEDVGGTHARRVEFNASEGRSRSRLARQDVVLPSIPFPMPVTCGGELELF